MFYMFFMLAIPSTLLFLTLKTPLAMAACLVAQTLILSMMMGSLMNYFWFMYVLILVFVGGVLILFIYATSIFPNEKFSFNQISLSSLTSTTIHMMLIIFLISYFFNWTPLLSTLENDFNMVFNCKTIFSTKIFSSQSNIMLIFLVNYLFYCMIIVIKMTNFFFGPLRKMM